MLNYNERKVDIDHAMLILASGFAEEIEQMTLAQKHQRFNRLTALNSKVKTNALHISLNFHPDDKPFDRLLQKNSSDYMEQIGFSQQNF